jgi:hypothetical protein
MRVPRLADVRTVLAIPRAHEWGLLAVLVFFTDRYRWMMDDAFIYFRYADNLVFLGRGLVYNSGEYVEGYSSPFWMLLLLPLRAPGIDYYSLVRALGFVFSASFGLALIALNRRLSPVTQDPARDRARIVNFPLAASAAHYGLTTHFSSGLETPLVQLIAPIYAAAVLCPANIALQCAVALAPLVRAECGLLAALFLPFSIIKTRRIPWWFLGVGALANGGWLLFRVIYYADFLPNTFYLKDAAHWRLGREYWENVIDAHHWGLWLLALALCAAAGFTHLRQQLAARFVMLTAALLYAIYVARIGGDMLYHRYAALPVCLALCASCGLVEAALARLDERRWLPYASAAIAAAVGIAFGAMYPPQLLSHPFYLQRESRKWRAIADPNWHRRHRDLEYSDARHPADVAQRAEYAKWRAQPEPQQPQLAVEGFCVIAYQRFKAQIVHDYGLTDLVLARLPRPFGRPGHKLVQNEAVEIARLRRAAAANGLPWYEQPKLPRWVQNNHDAIALLEQKLHNTHDLATNFELARTQVSLRR